MTGPIVVSLYFKMSFLFLFSFFNWKMSLGKLENMLIQIQIGNFIAEDP
jgi:hypothetical protein